MGRVGSRKLTETELRAALPAEQKKLPLGNLHAAVRRWAERQLWLQEAERLGVGDDAELQRTLARLKEELIIARLRDSLLALPVPSDAILRRYYQRTAAFWYTATTEVRGWLWRGDSEPEIAAMWRHTRSGGAPLGGAEFDWTPVTRIGALGAELARLPPGSFTQPARLGNKWAFAQLLDRRPAGSLKPFEEVQASVIQRFLSDRRSALADSLLQSWRMKLIRKGKYFLFATDETRQPVSSPSDTSSQQPTRPTTPAETDTTGTEIIDAIFSERE